VLHPGVNTSWTIGQTAVFVNGQPNNTFPNIGILVHSVEVIISVKSIFTTTELNPGLFNPQGKVGGSKLCKYPSFTIGKLAWDQSFLSGPIKAVETV
jgi:hypothetical protein